MVGIIDEHSTPSNYFEHAARRGDFALRSARAKRDERLRVEIERVHHASRDGMYGAEKVWKQLLRENRSVARSTVERLVMTTGCTVSCAAEHSRSRRRRATRSRGLWTSCSVRFMQRKPTSSGS